jgi:hypothetical protein
MRRAAVAVLGVVAGIGIASTARRRRRRAHVLSGVCAAEPHGLRGSRVRYKSLPPDVDGDRLLEIATRHDRRLLAVFAQYIVRVQRQGLRAVVLVCSPKRKIALFEDTGCSTKPDRHHWRSEMIRPCEFTLDAESVCREHAAH